MSSKTGSREELLGLCTECGLHVLHLDTFYEHLEDDHGMRLPPRSVENYLRDPEPASNVELWGQGQIYKRSGPCR